MGWRGLEVRGRVARLRGMLAAWLVLQARVLHARAAPLAPQQNSSHLAALAHQRHNEVTERGRDVWMHVQPPIIPHHWVAHCTRHTFRACESGGAAGEETTTTTTPMRKWQHTGQPAALFQRHSTRPKVQWRTIYKVRVVLPQLLRHTHHRLEDRQRPDVAWRIVNQGQGRQGRLSEQARLAVRGSSRGKPGAWCACMGEQGAAAGQAGRLLCRRLAQLVAAPFSRLVICCTREPMLPSSGEPRPHCGC